MGNRIVPFLAFVCQQTKGYGCMCNSAIAKDVPDIRFR